MPTEELALVPATAAAAETETEPPKGLVHTDGFPPRLTSREMQTLTLLASGFSTREAAYELQLSHQAVTYHVGNLLRKTGTRNRAALVARAYVWELLPIDRWPPEGRIPNRWERGSQTRS